MKIGQSLLVPLVIAIVIWYLINVLAAMYQRVRFGNYVLPMAISFTASILTFMAIFWTFMRLLGDNIVKLIAVAPTYQANLEKWISKVFSTIDMNTLPELMQSVDKINVGAIISSLAGAVTGITSNAVLILLYTILLLIEQRHFRSKLLALVAGDESRASVQDMINRINSDIQTYIWIKSLMSFLTAILSYLILMLVGVDFAAFWAIIIFLLNFIPNIGSIIGTILPALLTLVQFETFTPFFIVLIGITSIQFVIGNLLEPRIMGSSLNLSPTMILFSLVLWGNIWGIWGMFLCVPITVIIMIILKHFDKTRPIAIFLSEDGHMR
jgi:predicted PurR-regulated permease PerM